jgi:hypothetical protein
MESAGYGIVQRIQVGDQMVNYVIARGTVRCSCGDVKDLEVRGEFPEFEALQKSVRKLEKENKNNKRFKRWVADKIANPKKKQGKIVMCPLFPDIKGNDDE